MINDSRSSVILKCKLHTTLGTCDASVTRVVKHRFEKRLYVRCERHLGTVAFSKFYLNISVEEALVLSILDYEIH